MLLRRRDIHLSRERGGGEEGKGGNARWKFAIETSVAANTFGRQTRARTSQSSLSFRMTINAEGEEELSRFED